MHTMHSVSAVCHAYEFIVNRADTIMFRVYKRKTSRSLAPLEVLKRATKEVKEEKKYIRSAARDLKN